VRTYTVHDITVKRGIQLEDGTPPHLFLGQVPSSGGHEHIDAWVKVAARPGSTPLIRNVAHHMEVGGRKQSLPVPYLLDSDVLVTDMERLGEIANFFFIDGTESRDVLVHILVDAMRRPEWNDNVHVYGMFQNGHNRQGVDVTDARALARLSPHGQLVFRVRPPNDRPYTLKVSYDGTNVTSVRLKQ
jgi:hypothetical protein